MEIGVDRKDVTTRVAIFDLNGDSSNIGHYVLKVTDNKIGPIIQDMA